MKQFAYAPDYTPSGECYRESCSSPSCAVVQCLVKPFRLQVCAEHAEALLETVECGSGFSTPGKME
jgi:hypothetical protein